MDGYSIIETSNIILNTFKNYEDIKNMLYLHPWTYLFSNTRHFLKEYSEHNIKKYDDDLRKGFKKGYSLQDQLNLEYDSEYPFLYIKRAKFKIQTPFHYNNEIDILFAIGKRKNGQYHLLSPSVFSNKKIDNLFDRLKKNNVNKISSIIRDSRINIMSKSLFEKYGYSLRTSLSFTSFMDDLLILKNRFFNNMDFYFFETLYYQPTFDEAKNHILLKRKEDLNNDKLMYKIMNQRIYYLSNLFKFSNEVRPIVGTNIIIDLLSTIIEVLLMNCFFDEPDNAKKRIAIAAQIILENGDKFIPNWDSLTRNVKPI